MTRNFQVNKSTVLYVRENLRGSRRRCEDASYLRVYSMQLVVQQKATIIEMKHGRR